MARGSVTPRSDGWCIRLDVGVDPETGKKLVATLELGIESSDQ